MKKYIECAVREIEEKSFEITKQYLEVNSVLKDNGDYAIERISESTEGITIYFKISDEEYFLGVIIDKVNIKVDWVFIENSNRCYLTATSDTLSLGELAKFLTLKYTNGWSKGNLRRNGKSKFTFSRIFYEVLPSNCYETEESINLLLNYLSEYKEGIIELSKNSNAYISICKCQYISANTGLHFDANLLKRLSEFNLTLDIDTYICGNPIT